MRSESAGLEQGSGDVVGQVAEAQGRAAQVLQASVELIRQQRDLLGYFDTDAELFGDDPDVD